MPNDLLVIGVGFWSVVLGGGFYFARRFARAFERRRDNEAALSTLGERLAALEESIQALRDDVDRLDAGQEFTTRLLESRSGGSEAVVREPRSSAQ